MTRIQSKAARTIRLLAPLMHPVMAHATARRSRSDKGLADLQRAAPWFRGDNIRGVMFTRKVSGADRTPGELSIQFLVRRKLTRTRLRAAEFIPPTISMESLEAEFATDVLEADGVPIAHSFPAVRPVVPGCAISQPNRDGGTLGLIVTKDGADCYLSCAHVLAPGGSRFAQIGDPIEQPPDIPQPGDDDIVGTLAGFNDLDPASKSNLTDAAIAACNDLPYDRAVPGVGIPASAVMTAASGFTIGTMVERNGVASGPVSGSINGSGSFLITYPDIGQVIVHELVTYTASSLPGDSGAAVFEQGTKDVVGIHVGLASNNLSIFTPMRNVFRELDISL